MDFGIDKLIERRGPGRRTRLACLLATCAAFLALGFAGTAQAGTSETIELPSGAERTTYAVGPIEVTSGQNRIAYKPITGSEKPAVDGWITRIVPNMVRADGSVPLSSKVMFHHGVWINTSAPARERLFFATGEEKTNVEIPAGYGYRYRASDNWILNHMLHNLEPEPMTLFVTYTIDFIPDSSPAAAGITPVKPIWMDVESGIYPVFDVHRGSGGPDGEFTYPQDAEDPYPPGVKKNEKKITEDGVLVTTAGHVHSGGLSTDLYLKREGASYAGPTCDPPKSYATAIKKAKRKQKKLSRRQKKLRRKMSRTANRRAKANRKSQKKIKRRKRSNSKKLRRLKAKASAAMKAHQACVDTQPKVEGNRVHLFKSRVNYFEPRGPVSWDMAMYGTAPDWRVEVKAGDTLELQATYETERASWYESMGINVVYMAKESGGDDPYRTRVDHDGVLNHGHYAENDDHGGTGPTVGPDPATLPDGLASGGPFKIGGFSYEAGDYRIPGSIGRPPVVKQGKSFTFELASGDASKEIWHSLTSCESPCNRSTGIGYPIPDGEFQFDSGQLGTGGPPTVERNTWSTPKDLPVGTHTFFCRIHPLMRGAIRVVKP
ncbi:MAG: hypothetical protein JJE10_00755 [Thermoleophilia bacterium]|nr:hypothetical protein [Thermoleophilia bacterium]